MRKSTHPILTGWVLFTYALIGYAALFRKCPIQKRHNLSTGASAVWAECGLAGARGDAVLHGPRHSLRVIRAGGYIVKLSIVGGRRTSRRFPHILHRGSAGTGRRRTERRTGYHTLFSGPQCGLVIIIGGLDICKGAIDGWLRGTAGPPQEGQNLRPVAGSAGRERGLAGAAGNVLLHSPLYRVGVVIGGLHVGERAGTIGNNRRLL